MTLRIDQINNALTFYQRYPTLFDDHQNPIHISIRVQDPIEVGVSSSGTNEEEQDFKDHDIPNPQLEVHTTNIILPPNNPIKEDSKPTTNAKEAAAKIARVFF